jgi:hypothetical protein
MPPLYKFISDPAAVEFILQGIAKFTPIPELNDPSELLPNLIPEEVQRSLARLREHGYSDEDMAYLRKEENLLQRLAPSFRAVDVPVTKELATALLRSPFYDSDLMLNQLLNGAAREMSSKVGLFCLTRRYNSLPMWAHYAANAKSLVVEFQNLEDVFRGDDTGVLYEPIAVRYERERLGVTFDPRSHESIFFSKFQDWSYEQEVRVVLPLADCRQQRSGDNLLYLFDIPRTCITRVILGWNMAPAVAEKVRSFARDLNSNVNVLQAYFFLGRVDVDGLT